MTRPLWTPTPERAAATRMARFRARIAERYGSAIADSAALHQFSVDRPSEFWQEVWDEAGVIGDRGDGPAAITAADPRDEVFFPGARLSYAENLLRGGADREAVVFVREDGRRRSWRLSELREATAALAARLRAAGVGAGDHVAAWMPNTPETLITMLAANSIGAVFTSSSPDFGPAGVLDRFGQVAPRVLVAADGYVYAGRRHSRLEQLADVAAGLPSVQLTLVVGELDDAPALDGLHDAELFSAALARHRGAPLHFARLPFDHPGFVLYSSGTTGVPKCIVHRGGGLLLKHLSEHLLHCDVAPGDRVFYFTTCGWMMWNWLVSALAAEATVILYDGSPVHPATGTLFALAEQEGVTLFGTSAKYLDVLRKAGLRPGDEYDLSALRTLTSTGSPLSTEGFEYVYDAVKGDLHLASISGGTDICGCFVLGDPTRPVRAGEIQGPALGLAVDVVDETGGSLRDRPGERGDLVCRNGFPSLPLGFHGDVDGSRFAAAYFDRLPGTWWHGDFASWTPEGGIVIHGRSDATLNAGGVRIGTAEIYRQVELIPEVVEALAIGQEWDGDTRIVLFVRTAPGAALDARLTEEIRHRLREHCSPRHVPARIVEVADLPRTRSGKLAELAVADVVHGRPVRNSEALANAEALAGFADLPELRH